MIALAEGAARAVLALLLGLAAFLVVVARWSAA